MTSEQQMHMDEYYIAKKKYENASVNKRRAENELANIKNRRQQIIKEINENNSRKKRYEASAAKILKAAGKKAEFDEKVRDNRNKLDTAAQAFSAIGTSSECKPQNLNLVFESKNNTTKNSLSQAFERLKTTKSSVDGKIQDINKKVKKLESELEEGKRRERQLNYEIPQYQKTMNNALIEMAYHKRKMYE